MTRHKLLPTLAVFALALPLAAAAQQAQTKVWVNVRAGPAGNYPLVMRLPPGSYVQVAGCTSGYRWCDVIAADGQRGWANGGTLYYPYDNTIVPVMGYGPSIGIPIVTFVMVDYWGSYYRHRPWYGHRQYWGPGYGYGAGYAPGYGPGFGPGYGPGHGHGPGHVVVPGPVYVPRPGGVPGPGHVPMPPHGPVVGLPGPHGLPGPPGLPRPPRLPHPNGLPSPPGLP